MKMNMVEEFENIIDYLENVFPGGLELEDPNAPIWEDIKSIHLMNTNDMLELAVALEAGVFTTPASRSEVESILNETYSDFFKVFPDIAFIKSPPISSISKK